MVAAKKMKEKTEIIKSILNVVLTMLALMIIMFVTIWFTLMTFRHILEK